MKINKNSWHYKMLDKDEKMWYGEQFTLCKYFWYVVGSILPRVSQVVGITLVITSVVVFMGSVFWNLFSPLPMELTIFGALLWILFFGILWMLYRYTDHYHNATYKEVNNDGEDIEKEPNLLLEYLKAKKQKFCPIIEFED